jgi:hypothetical protein
MSDGIEPELSGRELSGPVLTGAAVMSLAVSAAPGRLRTR